MLDRIRHGAVLELRLNRPPVNALGPELVRELRSALQQAPVDGAHAIVLSGQPGMFSAGLDVPMLLALDRAGLAAFWIDFFGLLAALARSPIPCVAAITGHSPAGGAVLSIFCDYRIMADGPFRIGLNEVQVGLYVPEVIQAALRRLLGAHRAERLMVAGAMIETADALRVGLVDETTGVDQVVVRALHWCNELLQLPPNAMATTRRICRADLAALFDNEADLRVPQFAEAWFAEETQHTLRELVARLKSK